MKKLEAYGINGKLLTWIEDFLSDRKQRVSVNGSLSRWLEVLSGIPQVSVLGPVLFILYINDLPGVISSFCMLFADGTKLYNKSNTRDEHNILQNDLNSLMKGAENSSLTLLSVRSCIMAPETKVMITTWVKTTLQTLSKSPQRRRV